VASSPDALQSVATHAGEEVFSQFYIKKHATDTMFLIQVLYDDSKRPPNFQILKALFVSSHKKIIAKRVLLDHLQYIRNNEI